METALVLSMMAYAKRQGCFVKKNHGSLYGYAGEPDLLLLIPVDYQVYSVPVFVEVKVPGKKPTPLQRKRMRDLQNSGAYATWVDSLEKFKRIITGVKEANINMQELK